MDFDNDGDRDIFIALGHLEDSIEHWDSSASYQARNQLFMNTKGKFINVSDSSGAGMNVKLTSRAAAFDDLDKGRSAAANWLFSFPAKSLLKKSSYAGAGQIVRYVA